MSERFSAAPCLSPDATTYSKEAFPKHQQTVLKFRESLMGEQRALLDAAWNEYYYP